MSRRLPLAREDQEELLGETVVWVLRKRDPARRVTSVWLWNSLRRFYQYRRPRRLQPESLDEVEGPGEPAQAADGLVSSRTEMKAVLDSLPAKEASIVKLRLSGYSWRNALEAFGIPTGSHSRWVSRIRERLAAFFR